MVKKKLVIITNIFYYYHYYFLTFFVLLQLSLLIINYVQNACFSSELLCKSTLHACKYTFLFYILNIIIIININKN